MKYILSLLLICCALIISSQSTCTVCPNTVVEINAPVLPMGYTYNWSCTNGFTANVADTSILVETDDITCTLLVEKDGVTRSGEVNLLVDMDNLPTAYLTANGCGLVRTGTVCSTFRMERADTEDGTYSIVQVNPPSIYDVAATGWYRLANVCECGTYYSPAVYVFKATITSDGECLLIAGLSGAPNSCGVWEVQRNCSWPWNPTAWETYQTGVTGNIVINAEACRWRYRCDPSTGLNNYCTNEITVAAQMCVDTCASSVSLTLNGCSSISINWAACVGGYWELQKFEGGIWVALLAGTTTRPPFYVLEDDGLYRVVQECGECEYTSNELDVSCYPPDCDGSILTIVQNPTPCSTTATLITQLVDCEGVPQYIWNTGAVTANITGVSTGTYTVTVTGCCTSPLVETYVLSCPPVNPCDAFYVLQNIPSGNFCIGSSTELSVTPMGGTAPYTYEWRINSVTIVSTDIDYTFIATTLGTRVLTILITDANGCEYNIARVLNVTSCCDYSIITTGTQVVCNNTNVTWTVTPTNGTDPYVYNWSYQTPSGSIISFGTGATKTFNFSTVGVYQILVTSMNNGCYTQFNRSLTIVDCNSCDCSQSLTLTGCSLNASFSGNCSGYSYQLQYSPTGTGWTALQTGIPSNFNYTPTENGIYRMLLFKSGCTTLETAPISVNCVVSCVCVPSAPVQDGCELVFGGCSGYVANLDILIDAIWTPITTTSPYVLPLSDYYSYDGYESGVYRVRYTKSGCPTVFSSSYEVNPSEEPIVEVTRNFTSPPNDPYFWAYVSELFGGDFDNDWVTCIDSTDRVLYGLSRGLTNAATPPNFYLNTFTSSVPVTWLIEDEAGTCPDAHWSILSTTSTEAVIRFQNDPPAGTTGTYICSGSGTCRYNFRVTATDSCGRIVYVAYCVSVVSG